MITTQKVTSNVQSVPASLQTFIDMPNCVLKGYVQYNTVCILNVFCDSHLQIINCVGTVRIHLSFSVHGELLITLYCFYYY
jgi:hypothetical protein